MGVQFIVPLLFFVSVFCDEISNVETERDKLELPEVATTTKRAKANYQTFSPKIHSEATKFFYVRGHVHVINDFSLSHNFSFDCHFKYLPIDFLGKQILPNAILTSYLDPILNDLHEEQVKTEYCRKIRRLVKIRSMNRLF